MTLKMTTDLMMDPVMETAMTWTMTAELGMTMTQTEMVVMKLDDRSPTGATKPEGQPF